MRTVAMRTAIILKSMLPPREREIASAACARSGGPRLGNFEGAAIDRSDIENFAGLAGSVARDLRVPECISVFHARVGGARAKQGRDAENEQVKGPRHQLDDDEDEARDQPGKGNVHEPCGNYCSGRPSYNFCDASARPIGAAA